MHTIHTIVLGEQVQGTKKLSAVPTRDRILGHQLFQVGIEHAEEEVKGQVVLLQEGLLEEFAKSRIKATLPTSKRQAHQMSVSPTVPPPTRCFIWRHLEAFDKHIMVNWAHLPG